MGLHDMMQVRHSALGWAQSKNSLLLLNIEVVVMGLAVPY